MVGAWPMPACARPLRARIGQACAPACPSCVFSEWHAQGRGGEWPHTVHGAWTGCRASMEDIGEPVGCGVVMYCSMKSGRPRWQEEARINTGMGMYGEWGLQAAPGWMTVEALGHALRVSYRSG